MSARFDLRKFVLYSGLVGFGTIVSLALNTPYSTLPLLWLPTGIATWMFLSCSKKCAIPFGIGTAAGFLLYIGMAGALGGAIFANITILAISIYALITAGLASRLIRKTLMAKMSKRLGQSKSQQIFLTTLVCAALAVLPAWAIQQFGAKGDESLALTAVRLFGANCLGIIAFIPLIVGKVQLKYFQDTNKTRNRREYLAILVLILAIFGTTIFAWYTTSTSLMDKNNERFDALAEESEKALKNRLLSYEDAILGGAGLFYASTEVSRQEWREYVNALDVVNRYPGINGIGYIDRVPAREVDAFIAAQRKSGVPDFKSHPEVTHDTYYIINYIEPLAINGPALGLNIAFETNRKTAAELAARTGKSAITQRILLVQDAEQTPGFLLLFPIYSTGVFDQDTDPETDLLGWVYAPFIGKNLLGDLTASQGERIGINIYDGATADVTKLIFTEDGRLDATPDNQPIYKKSATFNIMQQDWTIEWVSTKSFETTTIDFQAELILITGIVIGGLLGLMLVSIAHRAASIQTEVDRKTEEINKARGGLQAVLDTVVDGIVELSSGGRILAFNPSAERIFGHKSEDVLGKPFATLLAKHDRAKYEAYIAASDFQFDEKVMAGGITISGRRSDGTIFPMELAASTVKIGDSRRYVASVRDITDQVVAQRALELSEKTFRQTMEQAPIGAFTFSPEGQLLRVNQAVQELLGYNEQELLELNLFDLAHPDDQAQNKSQMSELLAHKDETASIETRLIAKSGRVVFTEVNMSVVTKASDEPDYFIAQIINMTERKEMERIKNEFIATVSHELRTPITSISGSLSLIIGAFKDEISPRVHGLLTIAQRNSSRLIGLVNDILDMEKLGNGGMHYKMVDVNLANSLQHIVEDNKSYASTFEADLVLEPVSDDLTINVDEWRLNQVLSNFISNAVKFSKAGGTVRVCAKQYSDTARISVIDNGIGISNEFRNRIFTKFAQADSSTTREKSGTGLGLMISKQLVEQMGGEIGYASEPGVETVFWVEFKLQRHDTDSAKALQKAG
ncbi:CHASE domain-containing protein [Maritalea mediterranea]|uniref:histidine kinase n=1 Tax=Maritalea mediterranea TaxID=2909667 RepID=A0ABS9E316_9HYPH|nr:CHASE domain-containing protein [Maritalea mediterranea]MCF4097266.1 PAS domain S-box protein [Maritalea mediterranea]